MYLDVLTQNSGLAFAAALFLGLTICSTMQAASFINVKTLAILALGLVAFGLDTAGGVLLALVEPLVKTVVH